MLVISGLELYVAQASLELTDPPALPSKCWAERPVPPHLALNFNKDIKSKNIWERTLAYWFSNYSISPHTQPAHLWPLATQNCS